MIHWIKKDRHNLPPKNTRILTYSTELKQTTEEYRLIPSDLLFKLSATDYWAILEQPNTKQNNDVPKFGGYNLDSKEVDHVLELYGYVKKEKAFKWIIRALQKLINGNAMTMGLASDIQILINKIKER